MKFDKDSDGYAEVSFLVRGDGLWSVLKFLRHLQINGNIGHSHSVVIDPEMSQKDGGHRTIGWDGDGSDRIEDILVNGEPLDTEQFDKEQMKLARIADRVASSFIAEVIKPGWEKPEGRRKSWRKKKPDGTYEYRDSPPEKKEEQPKEYKHHRNLTKPELKKTLSKGHFSVISAGRNPNDEKEAKMSPDDEFFHKRHQDLQDMLEELGFDYTEAVGHYGSKEPSFLIFHDGTRLTPKTAKSMMVHHANSGELSSRKEALNELGKVLNQDSVLHGDAGKNKISFTSGKNAGKECGGKGWKETPKAKDFYTDIKLDKGKHTKFALNVEECFKKGFFSSVGLEMRVFRIADRVARFL